MLFFLLFSHQFILSPFVKMKKNLFMFLAGVVTCLSVISVSGFIASPAKTENKPAVVMVAPQTPKPNECDCIVYTNDAFTDLPFWVLGLSSGRAIEPFVTSLGNLIRLPENLEKKCIIIQFR